jgi:hypothetical protein
VPSIVAPVESTTCVWHWGRDMCEVPVGLEKRVVGPGPRVIAIIGLSDPYCGGGEREWGKGEGVDLYEASILEPQIPAQ